MKIFRFILSLAVLLLASNADALVSIVGTPATANGTGSSLSACSIPSTTTGNGLVWSVITNLDAAKVGSATISGETVDDTTVPLAYNTTSGVRIYVGYVKALASGGTKTLAMGFSTASNWTCSIVQIATHNASTFIDASAQGTGVVSTNNYGINLTSTVANSAIIAFTASSGSVPIHIDSGWTEFSINSGSSAAQPKGMYNLDTGSTGAEPINFNTIGSSSQWVINAIAIRSVADASPPTTPTSILTTVVSSTQIDLSWTASTDDVGVTNYRVERCQGASCSNFIEVGTPTGITFSDTGLSSNVLYRYRVRAFDSVNFSSYATIVSATTLAARQATVTWVDSVNTDQTGYTIQRKTLTTGTYATIGTVSSGAVRSYVDMTSPLTVGCYRVAPNRSTEVGPFSTVDACTTALTQMQKTFTFSSP